jgi:c-di-AMP phosphodiesterase-like protein
MTLTERATKYFNRLKRNNEFYLDRETTIEYCNQQIFPLSEKLVDIQINFSGYKLTIYNDSGNGFLLRLFSKADVKNNNEIEVYHFDKTYVVDFGQHDTAQFHFYITNLGELCTLGHNDDDTPNIVCSSIEKFIEQYALQDQLALQTKNPYYHEILNNEELTKLLEKDFAKIEECSDKYSQWFTNGQLTIDRGTWLDRAEFYLHVYGQKQESCDKFVDNLKQSKIIA